MKNFLIAWTVAWRCTVAMLSSRGISLGQTSTQLPALPQSPTPPSSISVSSRSAFQCRAGGVIVEEAGLADDGGADELVVRRVLRAGLQAAAATDAAGQGIALSCSFWRNRRSGAQIVRAVDGHPRFDCASDR